MFEACFTSYIDEECDVCREEMRTARKEHRCEECWQPIRPGEIYCHTTMLWDGRWTTFATCEPCERIARSLFRDRLIGEVWGRVHETYCDDETCMCPEGRHA